MQRFYTQATRVHFILYTGFISSDCNWVHVFTGKPIRVKDNDD